MALAARDITEIEREHPDGLSSRQIIEVLDRRGEPLTEATLRKYVQLGLLPRSRRVGQKGKHRGSRGIYPVEVIRRLDEIRRAMGEGATLEDLARRAQAVRAKLSLVRVAMEEVMGAAESDFTGRTLDARAKTSLRVELGGLKKGAKAWLRSMERWTATIQESDRRARNGAKLARSAASTSQGSPPKKAAEKTRRRGGR